MVAVHTDSQTGVTTYVAVPVDARAAVGERVLSSLILLPLLQCGVGVFAIFGPFRDIRHKLGRKLMALAALLSLPVTVVCCLLAYWSINYTDL